MSRLLQGSQHCATQAFPFLSSTKNNPPPSFICYPTHLAVNNGQRNKQKISSDLRLPLLEKKQCKKHLEVL